MRKPFLLLLLPASFLAFGCESSTSPDGGAAPVAVEPEAPQADPSERSPGRLKVTVDGEEMTTDGRVKSSAFTPSKDSIRQTLKGAIAGMKSTMLEPKDLHFVIDVSSTQPGSYELVRDTITMKKDKPQAAVKVFASRSVEMPEMTAKSGTLKLDRVELTDGDSPRVQRLEGSFTGTFYGEGKDEHTVEGRFEFSR